MIALFCGDRTTFEMQQNTVPDATEHPPSLINIQKELFWKYYNYTITDQGCLYCFFIQHTLLALAGFCGLLGSVKINVMTGYYRP
jgi:hypothetical protein